MKEIVLTILFVLVALFGIVFVIDKKAEKDVEKSPYSHKIQKYEIEDKYVCFVLREYRGIYCLKKEDK